MLQVGHSAVHSFQRVFIAPLLLVVLGHYVDRLSV
jgi:hypothetical protein